MKNVPFNVLGERYAGSPMVAIWAPRNRILQERKLWLAALQAMKDAGRSNISGEALSRYEAAIEDINLDWIAAREQETRHDVKAKIEAFNRAAGNQGKDELIHQGFTSRDLTDNVEQMLIRQSLELVLWKATAVVVELTSRAAAYTGVAMCARTHNVAAQATTLGKRFASFADEMLFHMNELDHLIGTYPLRGIKGPVGTQQDMLDLLGSKGAVIAFEHRLAKHLGFINVMQSVGQVYPRSFDFAAVSKVYALSAAPSNFALMVRLAAGHELMHEGFGAEQSGSSAMPHKMNSRTCERVNALRDVLRGHVTMAAELSGSQWFEGDVSCSVTRRVIFPDVFFTIDGLFESALTVLGEMEIFPAMIRSELEEYLPYLSTTRLLMAAVKNNTGREVAHKVIKKAALAGIAHKRGNGSGGKGTFVSDLVGVGGIGLSLEEIERLISTAETGLAHDQTDSVCSAVSVWAKRFPDAVNYAPEPIL